MTYDSLTSRLIPDFCKRYDILHLCCSSLLFTVYCPDHRSMIYSKGWSAPHMGVLSIWRAPRLVPDAELGLSFEGIIIISVYIGQSNTFKTTYMHSDAQTKSATCTQTTTRRARLLITQFHNKKISCKGHQLP